ncbi:hypothetical protein JCM6882_008588 [Rhodosporidiobolus microsporus]
MDRSHAPYSPIASTSRARPASELVPSSDIGEEEEARAALLGARYWHKEPEADEKDRMDVDEPAQLPSSEDELAMSPFRPRLRPSSSLRDEPVRDAPARSPTKSPTVSAIPSPLGSPSLRVSRRTSPLLAKSPPPRRDPSPAPSLASSDVTDLISRPRAVVPLPSLHSSPPSQRSPPRSSPRRPSASPRRSPSPAAAHQSSPSRASSPPPEIPPDLDAPLLGARSFRTRTAAQLKPYSTEQMKYTKSLLKNGWEGAVVRGVRPVEETPEEMRRKKLLQEARPRDSLGGWLVEEEGTQASPPPRRRGSEGEYEEEEEEEEESDGSVDGLSLLEREARRKERVAKAADAALRGKKRKHSPHRHGPSRIDDPHYHPDPTRRKPKASTSRTHASSSRNRLFSDDSDSASSSKPRRRQHRAESAPPSSSPAHSTSKKRPRSQHPHSRPRKSTLAGEDGDERPRKSRKNRVRADSEPPASSPNRGAVAVAKKRGMAKPSKAFHAQKGGSDGRNALDRDILNLPQMDSSSDEDGGARYRSDGESEAPSEAEDEEESQSPDRLKPSRLELGTTRKRALGFMMPAVFMKKAQADLKLMEREREGGDWSSGSEINSGDEEAIERAKKNRAKKRIVARLRDEPMRFDGDAYTDESGEDPDRTDDEVEQDQQEEDDAVGMWLKSFAPSKARGGDEDIVDRFLKRAKRPTKPRAGGGGRAKGGKAKADKGKGKEKARTKDGRAAQRDDGVYVAGYRPLPSVGASASSRRRPKPIALDTDQAVFAFAGLRGDGADESDDEPVIVSAGPRALAAASDSVRSFGPPAVASTSAPAKDGEIWASFGKFSHDFGIDRLPAGVSFASPDSFVKNGHLFSLVDAAGLPTSSFSVDALGVSLSSTSSADAVAAALPQICDAIFDALSSPTSDSADTTVPLGEVSATMRFLGHYTSTTLPSGTSDEQRSFATTTMAQLERLETRFDAGTSSVSKESKRARIVLAWHSLDVAARLQKVAGADAVSRGHLERLATTLVRRLIQHGSDRTMKSLKALSGREDAASLAISDVTVEAWLGLISLALRSSRFGDGALGETNLWRIVVDESKAMLGDKAANGPAAGEVLSYTNMMLCAISQFSPSGVSTSRPRLAANWPAVLQTLEAIQPAALAAPDHTLSSTAVARRDRYLWTLFARCLVFVERWGWRIDGKEELLPRLFDLLSARRLADLTTDTKGDIPSFLQNLAEFDNVRLEPSSDTAFSIFLKLVIAAANAIPSSTDAEKRRRSAQLTRLFVRLSPMVSSAWSRTSVELTRSTSILVNHYSLHLIFAILLPSAAAQRVEHARRLLDFANVDEEARKSCIRAILHFALAFRHKGLSLQPVVDWLAEVTSVLAREYVDVERQRRKEHRWANDAGEGGRHAAGKSTSLWHRAIMITMVLRSVQVVLRTKIAGEVEQPYPDLGLLHSAWTSQLLQSPLALDPMIGREIVQTITCFLDVRRAGLPRAADAPPPADDEDGNGVSQDDYGMVDDFDFDDPALNAMLGIAAPAAAAGAAPSRDDKMREEDKKFGELVKSRLSPAFFDLVSKIFLDTAGSGPKITDKAAYAQETVECWMRCAAVAVENQVGDWRPYLQYGDQSAKRISDPVGRRDVALFLIVEILKHDPAVYALYTDDVLEIWLESLIARRLTSQHALTTFLLNVEATRVGSVSPLLDGLPFQRDAQSGKVEVEQLDLLDKRDEVLKAVFADAARLAVSTPSASQPFSTNRLLHTGPARPTVPRGTIMNLLRGLLSAMRDNLTVIPDEPTRKRYVPFVKSTVAALSSAGAAGGKQGPFNDSTLPDLRFLRGAVA